MLTRDLVFISTLIGLIGMAGCTRQAGTTSTLSFRLQNHAGQLASTGTDKITNVFINVTGSGMTPVLFQCDNHSGARKACHTNADGSIDVSLQVDRGAGRLVQALVVYENDFTRANRFKYGTATADTSNDSNLDIAVADAGVGNIQGHVYGRYMDGSAAGGPSGVLEARFITPDGREMTVIRSPMIAGWFQLMLFESVSFNYYISDPVPRALFRNVNLSSPEFMGASSSTVRINAPPYDRPNSSGTETEGSQRFIVGFFGSPPSGAVACYDNRSSVALANVFQVGTQMPLNYNGLYGVAGVDVMREAGGLGFNLVAPVGQCADESKNFVDHIIFDETQLRNGKDSVAGFRGPFRMMDASMSSYATAFYDSAAQKLTVNWSLLPDTPKSINGLQLFMRMSAATNSNDISSDSGVDCPAVAADTSLGFRAVGDVSVSSAQQSGSLVALNIQSLDGAQFVLCPYLNGASKTYLPAGVEVRPNTMVQLDMNLVGSDLINSIIDRPGLGSAPYKFLKSSFTNGFHNLIIQAGKRRLTAEELTSVEYSVDGGSVWTGFQPASILNASFHSGPNAAIVLIGSDTGFTSAVSGGLDSVIKFRAKVASAIQTLYGISSDTYISGSISLVGPNNCPTPGPLEIYNPDTNTPIASATDILTASRLKLRWSACPTALEAVDYVQVSATLAPTNCLSSANFSLDPSDPLALHFSPSSPSTCAITTGTLNFMAPSNAGSASASIVLDDLNIP